MDLAVTHGIESKKSIDAISMAMQVTGDERNLVDYLKKISYGYRVFLDKHSVQRIAYEAAEDAAADDAADEYEPAEHEYDAAD